MLGQPVVIENRGGAGGNIGGDMVAKSAPDGYTLLMSSGGMVSVNPFIYEKMSFDPAKDLVPVAATARVLVFLVTRPDFPAKDAKSFLAYVKANPGKLSFGSPGNGSSPHLATEMLKSQAGLVATHAPYRGAAPALTDLLGGQLDFLFDPGVAVPHIQAGKLKLLAVGSPTRSPLFPDVPTLVEAGLPGFDADWHAAGDRGAAEPRGEQDPGAAWPARAHPGAGWRGGADDARAVPPAGRERRPALRQDHSRGEHPRGLTHNGLAALVPVSTRRHGRWPAHGVP